MAGAATVAAVVLAAVLVWAGTAKAARREATSAAFASLGLPAAGVLSVVVPVVELGTAALLLFRPSWGGLVALVMLVAFTGVIVVAIGRGASADCGCFASTRAEPVGPRHIVRNGMLAALAVLATGAAEPTRPGWAALVAVLAAVACGVAALAAMRARPAR